MNTISSELRYKKSRYITLLGAGLNILLGIIKILFGIIGHSHALLADGIHSFADLLTDILVLIAAKLGNQEADADHPYGHHRIETAATVALAVFLAIIGVLIIADASKRMFAFHSNLGVPSISVIVIAFLAVIVNESFFRYSLRIAEQVQSNLMRANAWHRRSDAASSLVVLVGIIASQFGFGFLDEIAAIIVGGLIIKMGYDLGWSSVQELVDTGLDEATLTKITQIIKSVPGVRSVHELRSRLMGGEIFVDVHVLVHPYISVSEGHYIGEQVRLKLLQDKGKVSDVVVHVDPENDEIAPRVTHLPTREQLLPLIDQHCQHLPGAQEIITLNLHYLSGKIYAEIILPWQVLTTSLTPETLTQQYREALNPLSKLTSVILYFK